MANGPDEIKPFSGVPGPPLGREREIRTWPISIDIHELTESDLELLAAASERTSENLVFWSLSAGVLPTAVAALYTELTPTARIAFLTTALVAGIVGLIFFIRWM